MELEIHPGRDGAVFLDDFFALLHGDLRLPRAVEHGQHIVGAVLRDGAVRVDLLAHRNIGHADGEDQDRGQRADEQGVHGHPAGESPQHHGVRAAILQLFTTQQRPGEGPGQGKVGQKDHHKIHHEPEQHDHAVLIAERRHQVPIGHDQADGEARDHDDRKRAPEGGVLLASLHSFGLQKLRHRGFLQVPQRNQRGQEEHAEAHRQGQKNPLGGIGGDGEGQLHQGRKQRHKELEDHQPRAHAHQHGQEGQDARLAGEQRLDVAPGHAQRQVHAEFLPPQLQHEARGVAEHQRRDQAGQHRDHGEHGAHVGGILGKRTDAVAVAEVVDRKHQRDAQRHRDEVDQVAADLPPDVPQGELSEHPPHPPAPP